MRIEELNNNKYKINGVIIYAPNFNTAIMRYERKYNVRTVSGTKENSHTGSRDTE